MGTFFSCRQFYLSSFSLSLSLSLSLSHTHTHTHAQHALLPSPSSPGVFHQIFKVHLLCFCLKFNSNIVFFSIFFFAGVISYYVFESLRKDLDLNYYLLPIIVSWRVRARARVCVCVWLAVWGINFEHVTVSVGYSAFRQKFPKLRTSVAHSFLQQIAQKKNWAHPKATTLPRVK